MSFAFDIIAVLFGLTALFAYLNHKLIGLPMTIGMLLIGLVSSLLTIAADAAFPAIDVATMLARLMRQIDFYQTLMQGMLGFLLFAGALHVSLQDLMARRFAITLMATVGVLVSTFLVGTGAFLAFRALGTEVPYAVCLVFGALISPTDPVAVLGVLKSMRIPTSLRAKFAGESLFNDGVGVVVFTIVGAIAYHSGDAPLTAGAIGLMFVKEALGGAALGLVTGTIVHFAMRRIDEYVVEIMLTIALVTGTYAVAGHLHVSGLIAVVVAGLLIGNVGIDKAMSPRTQEHLHNFWTLIDEILNAVLFLLIGLEVIVLGFDVADLVAGAIAIPLALVARWISVGASIALLRPFRRFTPGAVTVLTWGGLRGGISVALALSLPATAEKPVILAVTYVVVVFSVVVQGLTIERVIRRVIPGAG
jgi:CPA1 family monovalent cation:H+ antiporter